MAVAIANNEYRRSKIHPKKFALWIACASMMMLFAAFTSAYVVRQAAGNWLEFQLPSLFFYSTVVILLSSLTLHGSYFSFKQGNVGLYRGLLILSLILGLGFVVLQYMGWNQLNAIGVPLDGNPAGSFVYVISGVHAAHVLGGIAAISLALLHAFILPYKVTERRKLRFELTLTYWHFVDFLWVYLLGFFLLTGS
ncbi:MAG: cytochrome c oxidase subunit 3 [Bacteroidota bacterium]